MKNGKELKSTNFKNYNIVYGSVNNKNPKAVYINISAWAEPKSDSEINYSRVIRDMDKKIRQTIYNTLRCDISSPFSNAKTIVDFDIKESGVRYGKRSFVNAEITIFMDEEISITTERFKGPADYLIDVIIRSSFDDCRYFKFYKKKK